MIIETCWIERQLVRLVRQADVIMICVLELRGRVDQLVGRGTDLQGGGKGAGEG